MLKKFSLALVSSSLFVLPAVAVEQSTVKAYADIGVLMLEGKEHVFNGAGSNDHVSLLIWQSTAPVLTTGFNVELPEGWTLSLDARIGLSGDSHMEDYDWIAPFASPGDPMNAWSHQSIHPNTTLDWYFEGAVAFGKDIYAKDNAKLNANVGFKYVDVKWSSVDGSYTYSVGGFRDNSGTFTGPAIDYRQMFPSLFAGLDAQIEQDKWTFDFGLQAGVTFAARATDWHWARDLRFEETVVPAPTLAGSFKATYEMNENIDFVVSGDVQKIFLGRSDTTIYQQSTGLMGPTFPDASGAELLSGTISIGIRGELN